MCSTSLKTNISYIYIYSYVYIMNTSPLYPPKSPHQTYPPCLFWVANVLGKFPKNIGTRHWRGRQVPRAQGPRRKTSGPQRPMASSRCSHIDENIIRNDLHTYVYVSYIQICILYIYIYIYVYTCVCVYGIC